ncbi:MAG: GNAT family N-acetyltransferase [Clostridiales bacterium]|jgi:ribosomal protein S18 acetylase RimI-like enzyme|nr:GNAT family N-acetyltransferase [Clostridiales bacterium]
MFINFEKEPSQDTIEQIAKIAEDYTRDFFTDNIPEDTRRDLQFQRAVYLKDDCEIISFIVFTCWDGSPHITLMATKRNHLRRGCAKMLMEFFVEHVSSLGFNSIELLTVLPQTNPVYYSTIAFYEKLGFIIEKEFPCLWETGAIKLKKTWSDEHEIL